MSESSRTSRSTSSRISIFEDLDEAADAVSEEERAAYRDSRDSVVHARRHAESSGRASADQLDSGGDGRLGRPRRSWVGPPPAAAPQTGPRSLQAVRGGNRDSLSTGCSRLLARTAAGPSSRRTDTSIRTTEASTRRSGRSGFPADSGLRPAAALLPTRGPRGRTNVHAPPSQTRATSAYTTLKPVTARWRVGRTVLAPPTPARGRATLALATDRVVALRHRALHVTGAPFLEQDGEYLRCAHAAAWVCHYHAALRRLAGRQVTGPTWSEHTPATLLACERPLPSPGLTLNQLQAVFAGNRPAGALLRACPPMPAVCGRRRRRRRSSWPDGPAEAPGTRGTRGSSASICRYRQRGLPRARRNARTTRSSIAGWLREGSRIRFVACDDQVGSVREDHVARPPTAARPGTRCMVPLPPKVYLSGENCGGDRRYVVLRRPGTSLGCLPRPWQALAATLLHCWARQRCAPSSAPTWRPKRGDRRARDAGIRRHPACCGSRGCPTGSGWSKRNCGVTGVLAGQPSSRRSSSTRPQAIGFHAWTQ